MNKMNAQSTFFFLFVACLSSPISAQSGNVCSGVWWGRVPHPERCDKYYDCTLMIASERQCDSDSVFDQVILECVPGNPETCEIWSQTTTVASTTQRLPILNELCEGIFLAALPYEDSDITYIVCMRGAGVLFRCFDGERFDRSLNECVLVPTTEPPIETTEPSTVEPTTEPSLESICDGLNFNFIAYPGDCTQYIFCYQERINLSQCEPGTIFDIEIAGCRSGDQNTCEFVTEPVPTMTESTTVEPPTVEPSTAEPTTVESITEESTTVEPPTVEPSTTVEPPTVEPSTEEPTTVEPPTAEPTTGASTTTVSEETTVFNPCAGIDNGFIADPENCANYIRCILESPSPRSCRPGQIFSMEERQCVVGEC